MTRINLPAAVRITQVESDNYRTKTFVFDARLDAGPGQFVMLWLPRFDEKPFSLVCADPVTVMITAVGPFTRLVHELQVGDRLWLRGPFGNGFCVPEAQRRLVLVGGGYGVAPLLWLARNQLRGAQVTSILGARTQADLLYVNRFRALAMEASMAAPAGRSGTDALPPSMPVLLTTEDGTAGQPGRVTDALDPLIAEAAVDGLYACGPHGMLQALERMAQRAGVPCQLSWEAYMRCAVGICGACEHEGTVLCMDGPVLAR